MIHRLMACGLGLMLAGCATAPNATAQTSVTTENAAADTRTIFDTRTAKEFGDATVPLKGYLTAAWRDPSPVGPQHFCIVGYDSGPDDNGGDSKRAYVHWKEGNRLILWEGVSDPAYAADSIKSSRRDLSLTKDVVANDADFNSSTYMMTRGWVNRVLADCAAKGTQYTVSR